MPKVTASLFEMKTYDLEFPLKHPKHVMINESYLNKVEKIMGLGHPWLVRMRRVEYIIRRIVYSDGGLIRTISQRIKKR